MSPFVSGSAWAMVRDIANGHMLVTDRALGRLTESELSKFTFELERHTRELRGQQPPLDDTAKVRDRNRRLLRLTRAARILQQMRMEKSRGRARGRGQGEGRGPGKGPSKGPGRGSGRRPGSAGDSSS